MLPASEALQDATPSAEPCKELSVPPYKKQNKIQWRMQHTQMVFSEFGQKIKHWDVSPQYGSVIQWESLVNSLPEPVLHLTNEVGYQKN